MKKYFIFFSITIIVACSNDKTKQFQKFPKIEKKSGIIKHFSSQMQVSNFFIIDSLLITVNAWADNDFYISYFNKNNLKLLGQTGKQGKAPGEIVRGIFPTIDYVKKKIYIIDEGAGRKVYEFDIIESLNNKDYKPLVSFEIGYSKQYVAFLTYCEDDIFTYYFYHSDKDSSEYYYSFIDKTGNDIGNFEKLPFDKEIPLFAYFQYTQRNILYRNGKIITAFKYHDRILSYDFKNKKNDFDISGPDLFQPEVELNSGNWAPSKIERGVAYLSLAASDKYIYGLYSGQFETIRNYAPYSSKIIHVFDYEGNPIKKIILDYEVQFITYDEQTNSIVGIQNDAVKGIDTKGIVQIKL